MCEKYIETLRDVTIPFTSTRQLMAGPRSILPEASPPPAEEYYSPCCCTANFFRARIRRVPTCRGWQEGPENFVVVKFALLDLKFSNLNNHFTNLKKMEHF